jgi:pimeloyl-ACP methyl ester carboxylesterase
LVTTVDAMQTPEPFIRESGTGPSVVCIHANAGTSGQWRALMDRLSPTHRVLAPDCYGAGKSPAWGEQRLMTLRDEVDFLEPVFARAGSSFSLVGHSYGAAVALIAALACPDRVRSLALYEPTLFSLIDADTAPPNEADGIRNTVTAAVAALDCGDSHGAAQCFIDYWMGPGSWQATPAARQAPIAESVRSIRHWAHALTTEPTPGAAFAALRIPVLVMTGGRSTVSAHGVVRRLLPLLPQARLHNFPDLGHMGPVTHPEEVNAVLASFLSEV